jgi:hypothetical protein
MMGLYLLGVLVSWLFGRPRRHPEALTTKQPAL